MVKGLLVLAFFVGRQFGQFSHENLAEELADLEASVAVKDCEEGVALADAELVDGGIFHGLSPAWVGRGVPCISMETKDMC